MIFRRPPAALYFKMRLLQYPSAIKISPSEAIAIDVGLQKCVLSEPGIKRSPKVRTAKSSPGLN